MSVGHFQIQGYDIELYESRFRIHGPKEAGYALSIMGAYRENENSEKLQIQVYNDYYATVETESTVFRILYDNDPYEPNGQFEIDVKMSDSPMPSWTTVVNKIPKEVIRVIILVLKGDTEADDYRSRGINNFNNDPAYPADPNANNLNGNNSNTVTSPTNGGRRKTQRRKKRVQRKA